MASVCVVLISAAFIAKHKSQPHRLQLCYQGALCI